MFVKKLLPNLLVCPLPLILSIIISMTGKHVELHNVLVCVGPGSTLGCGEAPREDC